MLDTMRVSQVSGSALRKRRKSWMLTQQQLADLLGVSLRTVAAWELGENAPPLMLSIVLEWMETRMDRKRAT